MHCKIPVQTCDMSEQILFHTEQLVSETKRVNYHSKVCVCVCACVHGSVCVCLCLYIYTTSWAQKVKTCLAKGCCPTGLGQYIRFHMRCKFKSMTFPLSRKLPALLVPLNNKTVTVLAERGHDAPRARDKKARARGAMAKGTRMKTPPTHIRSTITLTSPHLYSHTSQDRVIEASHLGSLLFFCRLTSPRPTFFPLLILLIPIIAVC